MTAPLMLNGKEAQALLGLGRHTFRRLVANGTIPSWADPDTGTRWYHRPALEAWSLANGRTAAA